MRFLAASFAAAALLAAPAQAQDSPGDLERGYGMESSSWSAPIEAGTRDANGNRVIVDGRIMGETTTLFGGLTDAGFGSSLAPAAIGNQLTVVTQGNWNTVIIDSTQINNGDVTAVVEGANQ